MPLERLDANPLLTPEDLKPTRDDLEIYCTLNPGAVRVGDEILLLVRVGERVPPSDDAVASLHYNAETDELEIRQYKRDDPHLDSRDSRAWYYNGHLVLSSMSHLRVARSADGVTFTFDPEPAVFPATPYEAFGCEDARITFLDDKYYVTYTAVSEMGVAAALASTTDFVTFERYGVIFPPTQKDVCIFPEKIRGQYVCRHRPYKSDFSPASIWTAYSPDLVNWGTHDQTLAPVRGTWEGERVGCGAAPIRTPEGWLELYHAADAEQTYHLGAMLSDLEHPERLLTRSTKPILEPQTDYELTGVFSSCVFHNGLIVDDDGRMIVYYGAADRICAAAVTTVDEMIAAAKS
ncbi:MAG: glycoside hydrolase family 130 protein [Planctomycetota bacterium]|jgi:predicted GH43/DUF377 family glycosyl hydrolase